MADPSYEPLPATGDDLVDAMTTGHRWIGDSVSWSTSNGFTEADEWGDLARKRHELREAFAVIEPFVDLEFEERRHYADPVMAGRWNTDINVAPDASGVIITEEAIWALSNFPDATAEGYTGQAGDIFVNLASEPPNLPTYAPGSQGFYLFLHEIGHSLGLKHPFDDGGAGRPTLEGLGLREFDNDAHTMMAYNDDRDWTYWNYDPATPLVLDVIGLQAIYGKDMTTNRGDDVHEIGVPRQYYTIWDAGGTDTISVARSDHGWKIILDDGVLSDVVGERWGHALPTGQTIAQGPTELVWLEGDYERVRGSDHRDIVAGSDLGERIWARGGDDMVRAGRGEDMVWGQGGDDVLKGGRGDDVARGGAGDDRIVGQGGDDVLRGGGGDDRLFGRGGEDRLLGGAGADLLHGGGGDDVIKGGRGPDVVRVGPDEGFDIVRGFAPGVDLLELVRVSGGFEDLDLAQGEAGLVLRLGEDHAVLFAGLAEGDLSASDVLFV